MNEPKVLVLTNKQDITADYVIIELQNRDVDYFRFNTEDFPGKIKSSVLIDGDHNQFIIQGKNGELHLNDFTSIWYRRPGIPTISRKIKDEGVRAFCIKESDEFLQSIWYNFCGKWVSYPPNIFKAQNKIYQLAVAKELGFKIPSTLITNDACHARSLINRSNKQLIAKAVRQGILTIGNREFVIFTNPIDSSHLDRISSLKYGPIILQEFIPKLVDIRVTVIGNAVFAVEIHTDPSISEQKYDWREGDQEKLTYKVHSLPSRFERLCIKLTKKLGLRFGAIDMILSSSHRYYFLEINPNGQWAWLEQRTGLPLTRNLVDLLVGLQ